MLVVGDTTQAVFVFLESVFLYLHTVPFPVIESNQRQGHGGDISHCLALEGLSSSSSQLTCLLDRFFVQAQQKFSLTWLLFQLWLMFCFRTFLTGFKTNQRQQMSSILSLFMSLLFFWCSRHCISFHFVKNPEHRNMDLDVDYHGKDRICIYSAWGGHCHDLSPVHYLQDKGCISNTVTESLATVDSLACCLIC